jgi:PAS domain S-box-containing protein
MAHESVRWTHPLRVRGYAWGVAVVWTLVVGALLWAEIQNDLEQELDIARGSARVAAERDRYWMTTFGHAYVSTADLATRYPGALSGPDYTAMTPTGDTLVLISPALLAHEVGTLASRAKGGSVRLTSLTLGNAKYAPDLWEKKALQRLAEGVEEFSSLDTLDQAPVLRYMSVLTSGDRCLRCHAKQGYRPGDMLGGISIVTPLASLRATVDRHTEQSLLSYGLLWAFGLSGLYVGARRLREKIRERDAALDARFGAETRFRDVWEQSRDGMRLVDEAGIILQVNDSYCRMVAKSREELVGAHATVVAPPERHEMLNATIRKLFQGEISGPVVEFEMLLWNGSTVSCERSDAIVMFSRTERALLSIFRDLSDRRQVEDALRKSEEQLRLETLRTRIASDIHDDIGSTLSSIAIFADLLIHELGQSSARARELAARVAKDLHRVQESLHEIVWTLNPENDSLENITLKIHEHAVERLEPAGIALSVDVPATIAQAHLPMVARRHFYLIFKEAINNIVRHADCRTAAVRLEFHNNHLVLSVSDDGRGFDMNDSALGNGLRNMKRRAKAIGGMLTVTSAPGGGASVSLSVPME